MQMSLCLDRPCMGKKFWKGPIAYFHLVRHGLHGNEEIIGDTETQQSDFISLQTEIEDYTGKQTDVLK